MQSQKHLSGLKVTAGHFKSYGCQNLWEGAAIAPRFQGLCIRTLCAVLYSMLEMETSLCFDQTCTEISVLEDGRQNCEIPAFFHTTLDLALGFRMKQKADFNTFSDQDYLIKEACSNFHFFEKVS